MVTVTIMTKSKRDIIVHVYSSFLEYAYTFIALLILKSEESIWLPVVGAELQWWNDKTV